MNPSKTGFALAIFFGAAHLIWALLIMLGWAQALADFAFTLHMIVPNHQIAPFHFGYAVALVVLTSCIGYVVGHVFAAIWNHVNKK